MREGSGVPIAHVQIARDDAPWPFAEQAGIAVGDVIVAVDGASVSDLDPGSIMALIVGRTPGSVVTLTLQRGNAQELRPVTVRSNDR